MLDFWNSGGKLKVNLVFLFHILIMANQFDTKSEVVIDKEVNYFWKRFDFRGKTYKELLDEHSYNTDPVRAMSKFLRLTWQTKLSCCSIWEMLISLLTNWSRSKPPRKPRASFTRTMPRRRGSPIDGGAAGSQQPSSGLTSTSVS